MLRSIRFDQNKERISRTYKVLGNNGEAKPKLFFKLYHFIFDAGRRFKLPIFP